jgi:hypothetical protein
VLIAEFVVLVAKFRDNDVSRVVDGWVFAIWKLLLNF